MIYPSEMIKIGVKYTRNSWYPNPFETTADKEIIENVVITDIPASATEVKAFVWKDLATLRPLSVY